MKTLYLVRHGETLFNQQNKIQGWCDAPLTEKGIQQALTVKNYFAKRQLTFDKAYSSTSERARDTLALITDQPSTCLKDLREWHFGRLEGENERINPPLPYNDFFVSYGGESQTAFQQRAIEICQKIMQKDGEQILIVSHGAFCGRFREYWQTHSLTERKVATIDNCCIFIYQFEAEIFHLTEIISHQEQLLALKK
ncbi:phosphoglycerate mutase family protein [Enterococcus sp. ALS3]|uniref:Phosphoglycerate mutase family protein n=1 Tax=Enterococcus alishanensis TaxID=1303817 RepID=A0ABS6TGC5_9ENTE|nr:phosphoglycerate mutase family protein [Enterococcus alishanensis]